jgi:hypothetical protein
MSLQIDGDLACQTDYKFLNWMLKRKTEFWLYFSLAQCYSW